MAGRASDPVCGRSEDAEGGPEDARRRADQPSGVEETLRTVMGQGSNLEFFRTLLDELPMDVLVVDRQGRFEYVNPSAVKDDELRRWMIGRTERELAQRRGLTPEALERRLRAFERAFSTGRTVSYEEGPHGAAGRHYLRRLTPVRDEAGEIVRLFAYGVEITDRVRAEQALARSERHYRRLFDQSRDAVALSDLDGRVLDANPAAVRLLGFEHREQLLAADPDLDIFVEAAERRSILERVTSHGYADFETRLKAQDGGELTVNGTAALTRDEQRRASGFLVILRDVTEQRRLEEQLRQAQKMEAVGRLAGGIAHDFNNVLTAIQGYCDLLRNEVTDSVARTYAGEIAASAGRAAELTSKLLALGRQEGRDRQVVSINHRVWELEGLLERVIGEDVQLEVDVAPEAGFVRVDPGEIDQALLNLAVNARDAMPRGGRLILRTRPVDLDVATVGSLDVESGPYVELLVEDTGVGMDEYTLGRIFEPFFTTKEVGRGTGLGLAMVYAAVRRHGGHVEARSTVGRGTVIAVYLPRLDEPEEVVAPVAAVKRAGGHETLLLVEDDPVVRRLLEQQLLRQGFRVLVADGGPSALELSERQGDVDLLVSDVVMPGMSGPELARRLLDRRPGLPVLFISGYAGSFLEQHGFSHGEHEVLQKPFTGRTLVNKVREMLDADPGGEQAEDRLRP